tara:strand:- start:330 stop:512 length:183 start_codon:yes stop_codon:yes gene_type:complete
MTNSKTIFTIKAKVKGTYVNLWSGFTKQEARRVADQYNSNIPFNGDLCWIWDTNKELIVR